MRKICGIVIFFTLRFILSSDLSFCQSLEGLSPARTTSDNGEMRRGARFELVPDIEVMPDGFGDYLYSYKDEWGNKRTTNSIDYISQESSRTRITESILGDDETSQDAAVERSLEPSKSEESEEDFTDPFEFEERVEPIETISDPLEPINRVFFHFNDRLYFWLLKPVSIGYRWIFPEPVRVSVRNFFDNLQFPIRFVNCLLQVKFNGAGREAGRFVLNSTVGLAGFLDLAGENLGIEEQDEDFGQTLGFYGLGPAFYINWPILGASSVRDTVGLVGDGFLDPLNYLCETKYTVAARAYDVVNNTSLTIGDYEDLKRAALDPYTAVRDAYYQFRQNKIKE